MVELDYTRRLEKGDQDQRPLAAFFHAQVVCENHLSQTDGVVYLSLAHGTMSDTVNRAIVNMFTNICPTRIHSVHTVNYTWNKSWIHRGVLNLLICGYWDPFCEAFEYSMNPNQGMDCFKI